MADDRYRVGNRRDNMRRRIEKWREQNEAEAEAENAQGRFLCADCHAYAPLSEFEYVFEGETKVARRCEDCRSYRRKNQGVRKPY